jgi:hypothetical protein
MKILLATLFLVLGLARAEARFVRGTLRYTDDNLSTQTDRPIRSVRVDVRRDSGVIGTGVTNSLGAFNITIPDSVPAGAQLEVTFQAENFAGNVYLDLDWNNERIEWSRPLAVPAGTAPIDASATVGIGDFSVHFSILDALLFGRQYADARRADSDDVGQVYLEYPDCDGPHYNWFWGDITLRGAPAHGYGCATDDDKGWRDDTVLHELGHHVMNEISDADLDVLEDPDHDTCTDKGYRFAWVEGWATYFARAVQREHTFLVEGRSIERIPCSNPATEGITRAILWDLHDPPNEGHDRVDGARLIGTTPLRDVLFAVFDDEQDDVTIAGTTVYDPPTSILSFHDHLVARAVYPGSHADIDRIYQAHGVPVHAMASYRFVSVAGNPTVTRGTALPITLRISNPGIAYTDEPLTVRIWTNPTSLVDEFTIPAFTGERTVYRWLAIPASTPPGTLFVVAHVDPADRFPEVVENDNALAIAVTVLTTTCGNGLCDDGDLVACPVDCVGPIDP